MLNNFHLAVIIRKRPQMDLLQIPLSDELQHALSENWYSQYDTFVKDIQEIPFESGYKPEDHERFCEPDYKLPKWLVKESSLTVPSLSKMVDNSVREMKRIKGTVAFARNEWDEELMLFQNFKSYQIITPDRTAVLSGDTYTDIKENGLVFGDKLSAVYQPTQQKLLFDNFYNVNIFLPLSEYFRPASENDIQRILSHEKLDPEDSEVLATDPNQWFRTRFAMLERSRVLDQYAARDIQARSMGHDISIQLSADEKKIVFPADKSAAKRLLQFLNEEIFRGPITDELFETNSKKKMDQ